MSGEIEQEIEGQRFELALSVKEHELKQSEQSAFAGYLAGMLRLELKRLRLSYVVTNEINGSKPSCPDEHAMAMTHKA